ncbi:MAG: hypothetical protein IJT30_02345 [Muribaculaceae bacterium]|nr:hypothetical protein [Muribaculaceae bacterium]
MDNFANCKEATSVFTALLHCELWIVLCALLLSCSGGHEESEQADASAARTFTVEQAQQLGLEAARAIAASDHADTLALQGSIIDAHATRSEMRLAGNDAAAEAFDETLRDELRRTDPPVAAELFP